MNTLRPLSALRVLDFTNLPPGAACSVLLSDLGADVVRVESPSQRGKPSLVVRQVALSRGKRSITLDLRHPQASQLLLRIVKNVDAVLENAKPGSMAQRGFGYEQAAEVNPGVIWCAITGFGQSGPYAGYTGHDLSFLAHSGLLGALSAEQPWHPALPLTLQAGALCAVIGIQAALLRRMQTGKGCFIDTSLSEAATWFLTCGINSLSNQPLMLPATPDRRLYRCADGRFLAIACAEPRTWEALCEQLGVPELKPTLHRAAEAEAVTRRLTDILSTQPATYWVEKLSPAGAAAIVMNHATQVIDDPHIRAREAVVYSSDIPVPANPVRLQTTDGDRSDTNTSPPHTVGQDTDTFLSEVGFAPQEIDKLKADGII
jgi:crotonobetainyl-CoA:carnitine CoA-transferase CaiB-like acyl-CoA transferase